MQLVDVSSDTERGFFACLALDGPENPKSTVDRGNHPTV
jgi:hypothetical protein